MSKEANDLLTVIEAANMRHMTNIQPTWKSYSLHKVCKCVSSDCNCQKSQRTSCIDNAYVSLELKANIKVLDDAVTDHYPLLVKIEVNPVISVKLESIWRRNISKMKAIDFETALGLEDWTSIYDTHDPNIILDIILSNINSSLDKVAPMKRIRFRPEKPRLNLRRDTLSAMDARDKARKSGKRDLYKQLRNKVTKLVKRDHIQSVMTRLESNPGSKSAWNEAKTYLGNSNCSKLLECTNNTDPKMTAENQNKYFINKIEGLVESIDERRCDHQGNIPFKCESCDYKCLLKENLQQHVASVYEGKKPFKCKCCDYSCCLEDDLLQHVASVHEGKKPFSGIKLSLHPWASGFPSDTSTNDTTTTASFEFKYINAGNVTKIISNLKSTKALGVDSIATEVLKKGVITLSGPVT